MVNKTTATAVVAESYCTVEGDMIPVRANSPPCQSPPSCSLIIPVITVTVIV